MKILSNEFVCTSQGNGWELTLEMVKNFDSACFSFTVSHQFSVAFRTLRSRKIRISWWLPTKFTEDTENSPRHWDALFNWMTKLRCTTFSRIALTRKCQTFSHLIFYPGLAASTLMQLLVLHGSVTGRKNPVSPKGVLFCLFLQSDAEAVGVHVGKAADISRVHDWTGRIWRCCWHHVKHTSEQQLSCIGQRGTSGR